MRILHACKHFYPRVTGVTSHVEHLSREQALSGHHVAVATWNEDGQGHSPEGLTVLRADPGAQDQLIGLMEAFDPDVIHAHSIWDVSHAAARAARRLGRAYVITTHGTCHLLAAAHAAASLRQRLHWNVWRRRVYWLDLLRGADVVIALNALEETHALTAGVAIDRILRIPNAVDAELFHPPRGGEDWRRNADAQWFTVLFVGSMEEHKGIFDVLEAAAALRTCVPFARWLLCGDGPDLERAFLTADASGVTDVVVFLGRVERARIPELYQLADAVVAPSHMEAFSTVLLEGMASGLPCVGTNVGGTPCIIDHDETGFLIARGDSRALADKVGWLARHPRKAAAMGQAGREKVRRNFTWPQVAARIEGAYRLALGLLLCCLILCRSALAADVAAVDMLTMLDPLTGHDMDVPARAWRQANPVWNGSAITLRLARGETGAFQLVLLPEAGERLEGIRIVVELSEQVPWTAYRAWHIWNVPEVAVPMGDDKPSFDIPSRLPVERPPTAAFRAFPIVVELSAPRGLECDRVHGQVRVTWKGGGATLPLALTVLPLTLPVHPAFLVEMNSYGDYLRLLPADRETFLSIHRLFRHFRCTFTLVPYRQAGDPVLDFLTPTLAADGSPDFTAFDAALAGLFTGAAFPDGQPLSHFLLPFQAQWPVPLKMNASRFAARNVELRQAVARHIAIKDWRATRFQEFHNENPEHGAKVPWRLDEPVTQRDLAGHDRFLGFLGLACGAGDGACPLHYRIDISDWRPLRRWLQRLAVKGARDWSVSADPAFLDKEAVRFFRESGGDWLLAYGELPGFRSKDRPTPWVRFPVFLARFSTLGLDGFAQWQVDCWRDKSLEGIPDAAVPLLYSNAAGARDLIWPGAYLGLDGPLPSLRLFALREGLNLIDYASLARKCRPEMARVLCSALAGVSDAASAYALKSRLAAVASGRCGE
ncbi:glycosyltransferase [Solidesulfovibrio sp.]|uniref:glycosyltransferase n=1 Tax=Solidesulfovibrio sp. TaxID=2910990 RepID=UPI0026235441|nr:glycosyltransferase [Solidesulfovibrio sp.]